MGEDHDFSAATILTVTNYTANHFEDRLTLKVKGRHWGFGPSVPHLRPSFVHWVPKF
jgi:hypothetical protein